MTAILSKSGAISAGSSSGASHTPSSSFERDAAIASLCSFHNANGRITLPAGSASSSAARITVKSSSTTARFLIINVIFKSSSVCLARCVHALLERRNADATERIDEALAFDAVVDERIDHARHDVRHLMRRE